MSSWRSLLLIYLYGVASAASLSKVIPLQDEIAHLPGANAGSFALFVSLLALLPAIFGTMFGASPPCVMMPWMRTSGRTC